VATTGIRMSTKRLKGNKSAAGKVKSAEIIEAYKQGSKGPVATEPDRRKARKYLYPNLGDETK
jgi:hypothetical protein